MQTTIVKWGNGQEMGIQLPQFFLQNINISENETVDVLLQNNSIVIKKVSLRRHRTTKERLHEFFGEEYNEKFMEQNEIDWGLSLGKETW